MKILFTGYAYPGLVAGLESLGHEVITSTSLDWYPRCWGNLGDVPAMSMREYGSYLRGEVKRHGANALVIGKGWDSNKIGTKGAEPEFWYIHPEDIKMIRDSGVITMQLDLDSPDSVGFWTQTGVHPYIDSYGTCNDDTIEFYRRWCGPDSEVWRFWPAFDTVKYPNPPKPTDEDRAVDFVMVGSTYYPKPNPAFGLLRREVLKAAIEVGAKCRVYGPAGWLTEDGGGDPAFESIYGGYATPDRLPGIFAGAKVSYSSFLWTSRAYLTDRIPLIAGFGGFCMMEEQLGLNSTFIGGIHCDYHRKGDVADFQRKLTHWLDHPEEREDCAKRMQRAIWDGHTYGHRAVDMDVVLRKVEQRRAMRPRGCCR